MSRPGKCALIPVSVVNKRRVTRRGSENVPTMCRNRGNAIDLSTRKISATTPPTEFDPVNACTENFCYYPPPPTECGRLPGEMTENVPGGPPQTKILATPLREGRAGQGRAGEGRGGGRAGEGRGLSTLSTNQNLCDRGA